MARAKRTKEVVMYPMMQVLELACAAHRVTGGDYSVTKQRNKNMIHIALKSSYCRYITIEDQDKNLEVNDDDKTLAETLKNYLKKKFFLSLMGQFNSFEATVNSLLESEMVDTKSIGYIACLPSVYAKNIKQDTVRKTSNFDNEAHGTIGTKLVNLGGEIIEVTKYRPIIGFTTAQQPAYYYEGDTYTITAVINNKLTQWISKVKLECGPIKIKSCKVKNISTHRVYKVPSTWINYVRIEDESKASK